MDQQRRNFIAFLLLTLAAFLLANVLFPPAPPPKKAAPGAAAQKNAADPQAEKPGADVAADDDPGQPNQAAAAVAQRPAVDVPAQFVTLGSLDPASGYRMLVTATNTGAAVHRTELSNPRYRDEDDRSGYLGSLELTRVDAGLQVQVVGRGTPAEAAGIEENDVIVGIGAKGKTKALSNVDEFRRALARTDPGDRITLDVRRGGAKPRPVEVNLVRQPFAVLRPEIENYRMRGEEPPAGFTDRPSFLLTLASFGGKRLEQNEASRIAAILERGNWQVTQPNETTAEFTMPLDDLGLTVVKRYTLQPVPAERRDDASYPGYHVTLDVELRNTGAQPQKLAYRMDGPTGMPLEGWWYAHKISQRWFSSAGLRDVAVRFFGSQGVQIDSSQITEGDADPYGDAQPLAYAGVDGQYFSSVLIPVRKNFDDTWFETTEAIVVGPKPDERTPMTFTNVTCRLTRKPLNIDAGATHAESFTVFVGPKRPALLDQYQAAGDPDYSLRGLIYYGWPIFRSVAQAMLVVLHFFYGIVGNYGLAIIMLTVLVRGAMFPISFKQTQSMARMQALKPEMDKINEKFKTDMQKRSQAMQELYRKHNINPLGGCLPVFIQLPIFIGLYKALMIDVELRGSPLFGEAIRWCSNLAAPDMFLDWSGIMPTWFNSGQGIFALGPYLNILPLVTVALFLVTQKMAMPPPETEQAVLQHKMMKYMTLFMGLLFYKVASGLCIYFIASSLWGIAERKLLPKHKPANETAAGGSSGGSPPMRGDRPAGGGPKSGPNGSPSKKQLKKTKRKR